MTRGIGWGQEQEGSGGGIRNRGRERERGQGEIAEIRELWGDVCGNWCNGNVLESMMVTLMRTSSNGGYKVLTSHLL